MVDSNESQHFSILPYMCHIEHDIYLNDATPVSKIINVHNSDNIRVLQENGRI